MANIISETTLPSHIQQLLEQKQHHVSAIAQIEQTLAQVTAALGVAPTPAGAKPVAAPVAGKQPAPKKRVRSAVSTGELVLAFVKANGKPTTQAIMQHLAAQGRTASSGSNALSTLAKAKKLTRTPLGKGVMGSTYALA